MHNDDLDSRENRKIHYDELINLMPYKDKVLWAKIKIKEFLVKIQEHNDSNPTNQYQEITVSFSGGKDSTILLDLVLQVHKKINSKLVIQPCYAAEITFPSTYKFIRDIIAKYQITYPSLKDPLIINAKKPWFEILTTKGYPIFSKQVSVLINRVSNAKTKNLLCKWFFGIDIEHTSTAKYKIAKSRLFLLDKKLRTNWPKNISNAAKEYFANYNEYYFVSEKCCDFVKGGLKHDKRPSFIGTMAEESHLRRKSWIDRGCNIFNQKRFVSRPLSLWKNSDIWRYIKENNLEINPAYGYQPHLSLEQQKLRFQRLGCSSCPLGANIEQKLINYRIAKNLDVSNFEMRNRFEILKEYYPNIYKSQVIMTGMYKIIIDMDISIRNDDLYMELYDLRRKQIAEWYDEKHFRGNILNVLAQIENHNDYKHKGEKYVWSYTIAEINQAMDYFGFTHTSFKEFSDFRLNIAKHFEK